MKNLSNFCGVLNEYQEREITAKYFKELNVKAPSIDTITWKT